MATTPTATKNASTPPGPSARLMPTSSASLRFGRSTGAICRGLTTGAGEHERTRVREFDGNGNLRREVNPRGVDPTTKLPRTTDDGEGAVSRTSLATKHATVREFSADNLLTSIHLPWGERDAQDRKRFRQDFLLDARGRVQSIDAPYDWTDSAAKAGRTSYTHYDNGWIKTTSDQEVVDPDTGHRVYEQLLSYDYDRRGLQGARWRSSVNREITRAYFPNGKLREREASAPAQDGKPAVSRRYTYRYNPNGSLITINDLEKSRVTQSTTTSPSASATSTRTGRAARTRSSTTTPTATSPVGVPTAS